MNQSRMWTFGSIIVIVALIAGTWFLGVSPRLDEAATANSDRDNVEAQNQIHEATVLSLEKQSKNLEPLRQELAQLHLAIPTDADLSLLIGQLNQLAAASGVTISQLVPGDPIGYTPAEGATSEDAELTAALGSVSADNFLIVPVTIMISGTYGQAMEFVNSLQLGSRLVLVHGLSLSEGAAVGDSPVELSITAQTFVLRDGVPEAAAAAEGVDPTEETAAG